MLGDIPNLIIVAVEFAHLETAFQDMKSFVGENTIVLSLLCGIMSESISGQEIGMQAPGVASISACRSYILRFTIAE